MIITAALTGAMTTKSKNENVPITPIEIANSAYDCYEKGASIIHIHARNSIGGASLSYSIYEEIIGRIREKCNVLICLSTSNYGVNITDEARIKLLELDIDLATLTYGNVYRKDGAILNSEQYLCECLKLMKKKGIIPEIEIFNEWMQFNLIKDLENCKELNMLVQYIFGSKGGMSADYDNVVEIIRRTPSSWRWSAAGIGMMQLPVNLVSIINNSDAVRTGLEDNVYYEKGIKANGNQQLVERLARILGNANIGIANVEETKRILGIKRCKKMNLRRKR